MNTRFSKIAGIILMLLCFKIPSAFAKDAMVGKWQWKLYEVPITWTFNEDSRWDIKIKNSSVVIYSGSWGREGTTLTVAYNFDKFEFSPVKKGNEHKLEVKFLNSDTMVIGDGNASNANPDNFQLTRINARENPLGSSNKGNAHKCRSTIEYWNEICLITNLFVATGERQDSERSKANLDEYQKQLDRIKTAENLAAKGSQLISGLELLDVDPRVVEQANDLRVILDKVDDYYSRMQIELIAHKDDSTPTVLIGVISGFLQMHPLRELQSQEKKLKDSQDVCKRFQKEFSSQLQPLIQSFRAKHSELRKTLTNEYQQNLPQWNM